MLLKVPKSFKGGGGLFGHFNPLQKLKIRALKFKGVVALLISAENLGQSFCVFECMAPAPIRLTLDWPARFSCTLRGQTRERERRTTI